MNLFVGTTCLITTAVLDIFQQNAVLNAANDIFKVAFLPFPSYCLGRGIMDVALTHYSNQFYSLSGDFSQVISPLSWDVVIEKYVAMVAVGLVSFSLTIVLEVLSRRKIFTCRRSRGESDEEARRQPFPTDIDVEVEVERVADGETGGDLLVIDQLSKEFFPKSGHITAVDGISIGLPRGECFGLLGLNGAGKSTTFSILSGVQNATSGKVTLNGEIMCSDAYPSREMLKKIGYCPQTDPLFEELTAREHLQLYAKLHGMTQWKVTVNSLITRLGLSEIADKPSRTYSGGMKRKLSAAIALIGNPNLVLLDEPTTGMDPGARRFLWDVILQLRKQDCLVVITSHSMEECEALCTRLAVMANGQFRCLGTRQHLKDKFGNGYSIILKVDETKLDDNQSFKIKLTQIFESFEIPREKWRIVSTRTHSIELALLEAKPKFDKLLEALSYIRKIDGVEEFSLSQHTLESVSLVPFFY